MQDNLYQEALAHFNEPVLIGFNLARVVGYAEDDEDCYLIIRKPRYGQMFNEGYEWCTFVGGYTYLACLKDQNIVTPLHPQFEGEIWTDYSRLDSLLELNGAPKEEKFLVVEKTVKRIAV
jgi:hypothetical protein